MKELIKESFASRLVLIDIKQRGAIVNEAVWEINWKRKSQSDFKYKLHIPGRFIVYKY